MAKQATKRRRDDDDEDDVPKSQDEKDLEASRMPFLSHLVELRDRVRNAAIWFLLAFVVCWYFSAQIFEWLKGPMSRAWIAEGLDKKFGDPHLVFTKLVEPFWIEISIGLWAGIFAASPFIFHQLWKFIAPGLYKRERRITVAFAVFSALFFICGALFCYYFVLENLYSFLLGYAKDTTGPQPMLVMSEYLDLTRDMMLAFGAVFELPLLILFLSMVGLVTHRGLWKFNRWFIVIAFIVGAILTPSPDVVSQVMMAVPMVILYNLSIVVAWIVTRRREKAEAELRAQEEVADAKARARRRKRDEDDDDEDDNNDDDDEDDA
ncbi:MAG: twin-arginine translocase subunit TatC [Deltaproteobacteria bacterium]|nr:twin-arginine translocase subunit TatC [Deltaproteobacteria bacterium]